MSAPAPDAPNSTRALLAEIGWTTGELARRANVSEDTAGQWARDRRPTPKIVTQWLHQIRDAIALCGPSPPDWRGAALGRPKASKPSAPPI